jgi:light-regulated signal transduction histidine kinase (bacteriophytochrome)
VAKDGRHLDLSVTVSPIEDKRGKIVGASKVARDITERKRTAQEIHELNVRLEQRVAKRTSELESANKELEAFSYSVSHDLRAPLRAVDGFSQAVLEDYGPRLPEEGRRYLQTIREGAQRMGVLIDDLLTFSRLSRTPLKKQEVNTDKLVHHVLEEMNSQQEDRQVEIRIGDLPMCQGDPALLNQVWVNLLSNALKYTRHRENAVIEVGCKVAQEENVYFVRDNGAGFDMRYAHKLFGVFQRLHRADEFEGTGVGLAIVQRIINRHGGRVWADAAVDRGATFYFTLKEETQI